MRQRPIYFSFFMFDSNTRLYDARLRDLYIEHMKVLVDHGYAGFELHTGRSPELDLVYPTYADEVEAYRAFREEIDRAGLKEVQLATNVGVTPVLDPSSNDPGVRQAGLEFLRSRVDITQALRGEIMMGPVVIPYGAFIHSAPNGDAVWSDALQDALAQRYANAAPVLEEVGDHAKARGVKVAIEPITHWETPGPNKLSQLIALLKLVPCTQVGAIIDSAHEALDGDGPEAFAAQVKALASEGRLHYVQASPPDRGTLETGWLPWRGVFEPLLEHYEGPIAIEIFNAVPDFAATLRLSRRKYWIPGLDPESPSPSAYDVAKGSIEKLKHELGKIQA
jgi:sugar phosphate isomerase/epimerase